MMKSAKLITLAGFLFAIPACGFADRAHDLAKLAAKQKPVNGCNPASLNTQTCHSKFPAGCTDSQNRYDAYLDFLKNQTPDPALPSTALLNKNDIETLERKVPAGLNSRNHATSAPTLAGLGEGNIVTVIAYLYFVSDTGKGANGPAGGETTNCKLQLPDSYDYHIGLGFDPALAQSIRANKPQPIMGSPVKMDKTSVVAEMTPHTRRPKWTAARIKSLQGQQVKVVGQLMLDNLHWNVNHDCGFPNAKPSCWRATVWEVHPVTQFYVCNLGAGAVCDASSPANAWKSLDDLP